MSVSRVDVWEISIIREREREREVLIYFYTRSETAVRTVSAPLPAGKSYTSCIITSCSPLSISAMRHSIWLVRSSFVRSFVRSLSFFARRKYSGRKSGKMAWNTKSQSGIGIFWKFVSDVSVWFPSLGVLLSVLVVSPSHLNPGLQNWKRSSLWGKSLSVRCFSSLRSFVRVLFPLLFPPVSVWFVAPRASSHRTLRVWACVCSMGIVSRTAARKEIMGSVSSKCFLRFFSSLPLLSFLSFFFVSSSLAVFVVGFRVNASTTGGSGFKSIGCQMGQVVVFMVFQISFKAQFSYSFVNFHGRKDFVRRFLRVLLLSFFFFFFGRFVVSWSKCQREGKVEEERGVFGKRQLVTRTFLYRAIFRARVLWFSSSCFLFLCCMPEIHMRSKEVKNFWASKEGVQSFSGSKKKVGFWQSCVSSFWLFPFLASFFLAVGCRPVRVVVCFLFSAFRGF